MRTRLQEVLTAQGIKLPIFCGGTAAVGIGVTGTWTGTLTFKYSTDGINFNNLFATPFPSGTAVNTVTANGNWFIRALNYVVVQVEMTTLLTGSPIITLCAAGDNSWQDAFLVATSQFVEQQATGGLANTITIAAQANRAWRCRTVSGGFSVAPAAAVRVTITDGASAVIWSEWLAATAGQWKLNLPADSYFPTVSLGGVVGTAGNSMVVTVAAPGGAVVTDMSCEILTA